MDTSEYNVILDNTEFERVEYFDTSEKIKKIDVVACSLSLLAHSPSRVNNRQQGICILLSRSKYYIAAVLAAWNAGFYVVPLNTNWPIKKNKEIIEKIQPCAVLVDDNCTHNFDFPTLSKSFLFDTDKNICDSNRVKPFTLSPTDIAYIIFTSGSTGEAKGVVISGESYRSYIKWTKRFFRQYSVLSTLLITSELTFDITMGDIAFALAFGTNICVAKNNNNIPSILAMIMKHKIEVLYSVPSTHIALIDFAKNKRGADISSLRLVLSGGDRFPWQLVNEYQVYSPSAHFFNVYGPTEVTINCFAIRLDDKTSSVFQNNQVPIGNCFDHLDYILFDIEGTPSDKGELCISGAQLMMGYHGDDEKTGNAFIEDPRPLFDKQKMYRTGDIGYEVNGIMFLEGRLDGLIKLKGYRVHPDEVSRALDNIDEVEVSCVVPVEQDNNKTRLVAFIRLHEKSNCNEEQIRKKLIDLIPSYMVPSEFLFVREFPYNQSGKIDRKALIGRLS